MRELIIDNFAGGGGASTGIEMAVGRSVDIAINHDPAAIAMHKVNHPKTRHYADFCKNCADEYKRITELWVTGKDDTLARLANIKSELRQLSFDLAQRANDEERHRYDHCYNDKSVGFSEGIEQAYRASYKLIDERFGEVMK